MEKKLKVGLIGLGGIMGYAHMPRYRGAEDVEIVAICDILPEKIEAFHRNFGMREVPSFTDYKELLEVEGLDYVDICTPNYLHSIIAVDALNKGINVFCEKPDAVSVEEALKMKEAAEKSGKNTAFTFSSKKNPPAGLEMVAYNIYNLKSGDVSEAVPGQDAVTVALLVKRTPADMKEFAASRMQYEAMCRSRKAAAAMASFEEELAAQCQMDAKAFQQQ